MTPWILKMRSVAKDIILFNKKRTDLTHRQAMVKFYAIMKKHGIRQGEWNKSGNGRRCNNYEWTMCLTLFMDVHSQNNHIAGLLGNGIPTELLAYGKKPKVSNRK